MAEFEQSNRILADFERHEAPCKVVQLASRGVTDAPSRPLVIQAYIDGHTHRATAGTAKEAFAKAIDRRFDQRRNHELFDHGVLISNGAC